LLSHLAHRRDRVWIAHLLGIDAGFFGAAAPVFGIIDALWRRRQDLNFVWRLHACGLVTNGETGLLVIFERGQRAQENFQRFLGILSGRSNCIWPFDSLPLPVPAALGVSGCGGSADGLGACGGPMDAGGTTAIRGNGQARVRP
jgi:hypothetical protein